jgi:2-methylisocitrate lyase-like PEP mutase family enzyme
MVPGGKTPVLPPAELERIGYKLALYPVMLLTAAISAMQTTLVPRVIQIEGTAF